MFKAFNATNIDKTKFYSKKISKKMRYFAKKSTFALILSVNTAFLSNFVGSLATKMIL